MSGYRKILGSLLLMAVLAAVGLAAKTPQVTRADVALNEDVAGIRNGGLTVLAKAATAAASSTVGVALALLIPALLWLIRRYQQAVRTLLLLGGAMAVTFAAKLSIHEHRPPKRLWLIPPDNPHSFPSGHTAIATAVAMTAFFLAGRRWRPLVLVLGAVFAAGTGFARIYLGVHYLPDVIAGALAAASAGLMTAGLLKLPPVRTRLDALQRPGRHRRTRTGASRSRTGT
ncbi:phosphatase PAP2 family protein [Streptomyces albus]|uniref:phosphatase PAP2 family protein n=1 Tax=Streptomyces albus TaxID=1888 RepID=UPI000A7758B3|nr:phosphatase PAP2 family protein [Streptomyces albus]